MDEVRVKPDPDGEMSPVSLPPDKRVGFIKQERDSSSYMKNENSNTDPIVKKESENENEPGEYPVDIHSTEQLSSEELIIPDIGDKISICGAKKNVPDIRANNSSNNVETKDYQCGICDEQFSKADELQEHLIQIHQLNKREKIKHEALVDAYLSQQQKQDQQDKYKCEICFKVYVNSVYFERHMNIHKQEKDLEQSRSEEKPFKCDVCLKSYSKAEQLKKHRIIHKGEKSYECDVCGETVVGKRQLVVHKLIHSDEEPYTCEVCNKRFAVRSSLNGHMRNHGPRCFVCDVCNKSFPLKKTLTIHQRIHTGERPYACHICSKKFRQKGALTGHLRIHSEGSV